MSDAITKGRATEFGFEWGPATVERAYADGRYGVVLLLRTKKQEMQVRITPSGLIRLGDIVNA